MHVENLWNGKNGPTFRDAIVPRIFAVVSLGFEFVFQKVIQSPRMGFFAFGNVSSLHLKL